MYLTKRKWILESQSDTEYGGKLQLRTILYIFNNDGDNDTGIRITSDVKRICEEAVVRHKPLHQKRKVYDKSQGELLKKS